MLKHVNKTPTDGIIVSKSDPDRSVGQEDFRDIFSKVLMSTQFGSPHDALSSFEERRKFQRLKGLFLVNTSYMHIHILYI